MHNTAPAREALWAIPCPPDRELWWPIVGSALAEGLSEEEVLRWCELGPNFDRAEALFTIRSLARRPDNGRRGSLYAMARDAGWREPMNGHAKSHHKAQAPRRPEPKAKRPPFDFESVWRESKAATAAHPYIVKKRGLPNGLRVYRGPLKVAGQALDGALLVPVLDADGNLQSWQGIPAGEGKKLNAPGARLAGGRFIVGGDPRDGEPLHLCKGLGQAWSAHQATGKPAIVCFGAGNVESVARDLNERHPKARIVIVADAGKESDAERIAGMIGGAWVEMPTGSPSNFDLNDFHQQERSLSAVAALLAQARESGPASAEAAGGQSRERCAADDAPRLLDLTTLAQRDPKPPAFIVPGWLPAGEVTLFAAHGGTGKSATALRLAVCLTEGRDWHGLPVEQRCVDYVSFEDSEPVLHWRLHRICQALGVRLAELDGRLRVFDATKCGGAWYSRGQYGETGPTPAFHDGSERIGGPGRVVMVDGSSDTFAGNENDRAQVKAFVRLLRRLIADDGALLLIAHVDKQAAQAGADSLGFSGSTGWNNSVRARWFMFNEVDAEDFETGSVVLEVRKSNLGRIGGRIVLSFDESRGTFERIDSEPAKRDRSFQRVDEAEAILRVIRDAWAAGDPIPAATAGTRTAHSVCAARDDFPASLKGRSGQRRFRMAMEQLRAAGAVHVEAFKRPNRHLVEVLCASE